MVLFGYVLVLFGMIPHHLVVSIVQICYHSKSGTCNFKNNRVISILVLLDLVWFGMVWRFHEGAVMLL